LVLEGLELDSLDIHDCFLLNGSLGDEIMGGGEAPDGCLT
jgi:hypothetical protein